VNSLHAVFANTILYILLLMNGRHTRSLHEYFSKFQSFFLKLFLGLPIGVRILKSLAFSFPISKPQGKISQVSDFTLWFGYSLYKSSKFQLSTSTRSGLAFVEKLANFHVYWVHHLVSCNSGFRIAYSTLEASQQRFVFKYNKLYMFTHKLNVEFSISYFEHNGTKFSGFRMFPFG
jgi:hypothetical protein